MESAGEVEQLFTQIIGSGITGGILWACIYYVFTELRKQYTSRIEALEKHSATCEGNLAAIHERMEKLYDRLVVMSRMIGRMEHKLGFDAETDGDEEDE